MKGPISRILVYVDGSESSISAAMYAIALAKSTGASLTALYVINTRALNDLVKARIFIQEEEAEYHRDLEQDAERYLKHVRKMAEQKGLDISTISKSGTIHREIKNEVKESDCDMLILGGVSNIRSRRDEFFNETDRAMRSVTCPVLIIKDEEHVWEIFESV